MNTSGHLVFLRLRVCAVLFVFLGMSSTHLRADARGDGLSFVVLDGSTTSYFGEGGTPNWKTLESWIKTDFPDDKVQHINLQRTESEPVVRASDILKLKPDVVIFHWSAFGTTEKPDSDFCRPFSRDDSNDCARKLLSLLQQTFKGNNRIVFIGYSRAPNLCAISFQTSVKNRLEREFNGNLFTARTFLIAMNKGSRRGAKFEGASMQLDWARLLSAAYRSEMSEYDKKSPNNGDICVLGKEKSS